MIHTVKNDILASRQIAFHQVNSINTFACMPRSKVFQSIQTVKTHGKITINEIHDLDNMYRWSNKNWNETNKISHIKM